MSISSENPATRPDVYRMLLAMLPNGRAWQSMDGALSYDIDPDTVAPGSVLRAFWWAAAAVFFTLEQNVDLLRSEAFAAAVLYDKDVWQEEYGLPSEDDPYGADFAAKMRAEPTTDPAEYEALVAALGWDTDMRWLRGSDPIFPGVFSTLHIIVHVATSTAVQPVPHVGHDSFHCGRSPLGTPDVSRIEKVMGRIIPAHADITSEAD
jgi:hypothetical protein